MKKRVLSLFMALALCFSMLPTAALATENTTEPSTQLTETTSVPEEPEEPETPAQPEETKTPDQGEDTKTPDPSEEPPQDEEPPAAEEGAPVGAMLSAAATKGEEHTHYLCGGDTCNKVGHADEGTATTFQPWDGSNTNGAFYLTKDWTLTSTITVPTDSSLTLCLNGHSITLGSQAHNVDPGSYDVFLVQRRATFTLCDCKDKNGNYGTIGHYNPTENQGPGVNVAGTFNMYGGKIFQNQVKFYDGNPRGYGGGVLVSGEGTFNMFGGEITGNTAKSGGGVYVDGMFSMSGGTIYDNAGERGGGVYVTPNGMFNMSGSAAITGNTGTYGGVYVDGTFSMSGGTICGNTESSGGGVYVESGTFNMSGSAAITGNTVTGKGGGVYVRDTAKKMNVSGDVKIENNWKGGTLNADTGLYDKGNGSANNLCLGTDKYVIITGDGGLGKDARIGVTTAKAPTSNENISIATGAKEELPYYTNIFTPDVQNQGYVITKKGDELSVHQHSWGYTESGATITAECRVRDCPNPDGGSVTIKAPEENTLTYTGQGHPATLENHLTTDAPVSAITYTQTAPTQQALETNATPTDAGNYTASITVGNATANVEYTIAKAEPKIASWSPYTGPLPAYNGEQVKNPTYLPMTFGEFADITGFKWYQATKNEDSSYTKGKELSAPPTDAGDYYIEAIFKEGTNTTAGIAGTGLTVRPMPTEKVVNAKEYPVYANRAYTYEIDLNSYLTDLHLGTGVTYTKTNGDLPVYFKAGELSISSDGKLTVPVKNTTTAPLPSTIATIVVWVKSSNYDRITLSVPIQMVAKKSENLAVGMTGWTYGEIANEPEFSAPEGVTATVTYAKADGTALGERPTNAGHYTVKVQYETNDNIYTGTAKFTIEPKSIAGATVTLKKNGSDDEVETLNLPYTGAEQIVAVGSVKLSGKEEALHVTQDYTEDTENTKATNVGSYTVTVQGTGNYKGTAQVTWKITPAPLTIADATAKERVYVKDKTDVEIISVTFNGWQGPKAAVIGDDYTATGKMADDTAGDDKSVTGTVELKGDAAKNYTLQNNTFETTVNIKLADYGDKTASGFAKKGTSGTVDLSALIVEGGKLSLGTATDTNRILDGDPTVEGKTLKFKFNNSATADQTATVPVKVTNIPNYNGYDITVTLTVTDKDVPTLNVKNITKPYDGKEVSTDEAHGAATFSGQTVAGTWSWKEDAAAPKNVVDSGIYTIVFKPTDTTKYAEAQTTITVTINKALITVTALNKQITVGQAVPDLGEPKPNKDYTVTGLVGNDQLGGTLKMKYQKNGQDVTVSTNNPGSYDIVITGVATPTNGDNYTLKLEKGTLTIQAQSSGGGSSSGGSSSSGGGGGGSSSSDRDNSTTTTGKTDTTTKPDGTKVQTETRADGTKIQTETKKDGSTVKTETKKDGSSVTEAKAADGSTGTVKTDKHGQTTAETALSSKAIETAKKSGEPVKAPVEVKASRDSSTAPTVKVELPKNSGETKVEIPVSNVKPGTVAVLVHADGTEEIVKNSLPTEDGIQLTVNGGATVKIVDNSKDFADTRNHWAKDAIDFVSARGLVSGMSGTTYAPDASTTRAQLWTILARQNNADLTGGATWFENAQNWAKEKGISDGTNPNGTINRAQMVTMLWRAMGQPAAASGASFADVPADSYYAQAVAWAVENGITAGVGGGRFDPNSTCTRGQIATFLHRSYLSK